MRTIYFQNTILKLYKICLEAQPTFHAINFNFLELLGSLFLSLVSQCFNFTTECKITQTPCREWIPNIPSINLKQQEVSRGLTGKPHVSVNKSQKTVIIYSFHHWSVSQLLELSRLDLTWKPILSRKSSPGNRINFLLLPLRHVGRLYLTWLSSRPCIWWMLDSSITCNRPEMRTTYSVITVAVSRLCLRGWDESLEDDCFLYDLYSRMNCLIKDCSSWPNSKKPGCSKDFLMSVINLKEKLWSRHW